MSELINSGDPVDESFPTGRAVGEAVPDFELPDQFGNLIRFSEARGSQRALILFHRSAAW
jgi:peroxiredoxin